MSIGTPTGFVMAVLVLAAAAAEPVEAQQQAPTVARITMDEARTALDAAEAEARSNDWNLVFVISDAEGTPIYLRRMDGAPQRNHDVARRDGQVVGAFSASGAIVTVRGSGSTLTAQPSGQPEATVLEPRSQNRFAVRGVDAEVEFVTDEAGVVTLVLHQGGQQFPARRRISPWKGVGP